MAVTHHPGDPSIESILARPPAERRREYKYRFAQAFVFGLPVLILHFLGHRLGGPEAHRWVSILQAVLAGWVMYVGAAGMLFEGLLLLGARRFSLDLLIALGALGAYVVSVLSTIAIVARGESAGRPLLFHLSVIMIGLWCGVRWWLAARRGR